MKLTPVGIISSSKALNIVSIYPVDSSESDIISLVAICRSGIRLYFSIIGPVSGNMPAFAHQGYPTQQQRSLKPLVELDLLICVPPEENRVRDPKSWFIVGLQHSFGILF